MGPGGLVLRVQTPVDVRDSAWVQKRVCWAVLELGHRPLECNLSIDQNVAHMYALQWQRKNKFQCVVS